MTRLTPAQTRTLKFIAEGRDMYGISPSTNAMIDRLTECGLISRGALMLTEAGEEALAKAQRVA